MYVLEFNTRFGDPETEVLLPRLTSNLLDHILDSIHHQEFKLTFDESVAVGVNCVSEGYPNHFEKLKEITGLVEISDEVIVYQNGTIKKDRILLSNGGRVLTVVSKAENYQQARKIVYQALEKIHFETMSYRKDIGKI